MLAQLLCREARLEGDNSPFARRARALQWEPVSAATAETRANRDKSLAGIYGYGYTLVCNRIRAILFEEGI